MAYDEDLADRIRELLGSQQGVEEKRMFGGLAFLINGNMSVAASGQGGLLVRVAPEDTDKLLERGIYVIGFSFPVVPKDKARIRTQISAAHEREHIDRAIAAFAKVGRELGVIR